VFDSTDSTVDEVDESGVYLHCRCC
jgi:hypothetical protein